MLASRIQTDPTNSGAAHVLVSQSETRISLTLFAPPTGRATIWNELSVTAGSGIILIPGQDPIYMHIHTYGDVIQREWYIIYDGLTAPISYIEALATCEHDREKYQSFPGDFKRPLWA